jgi:hypothetical protein
VLRSRQRLLSLFEETRHGPAHSFAPVFLRLKKQKHKNRININTIQSTTTTNT